MIININWLYDYYNSSLIFILLLLLLIYLIYINILYNRKILYILLVYTFLLYIYIYYFVNIDNHFHNFNIEIIKINLCKQIIKKIKKY